MSFFILIFVFSLLNTITPSLRSLTLSKTPYIYSLLSQNQINVNTLVTQSSFYSMPISVGTPPQQFNAIIATSSNSLLLIDSSSIIETTNKYDHTASSTFSNTSIFQITPFYDMNLMFGYIYKDVLTLQNSSLNEFNFVSSLGSTVSPSHMQDGIIGFNRNKSNLVNTLKEQNQAEKNIFSLYDPADNETNAYLFIGNYHDNFTKFSNKIASCESKDELYWKCNVTYLIIGNSKLESNYFELNENVIIDSGSNAIQLPYKYKEQLFNKLSNNCKINSIESVEYITCPLEDINDITLGIDKYGIVMEKKYLWEVIDNVDGKDVYALNVFFNKNNNDNVIIGVQIFKGFHIAFDGEENKISFYSPKGLVIDLEKNNSWIIIVIIVGAALVVGVLVYLIFRCVCKKHKFKGIESEIDGFDKDIKENLNNLG